MPAVALDSNTPGLLVHPKREGEPKACRVWARAMLRAGWEIAIPEIADCERRRELLRIGSHGSIARLNFAKRSNCFLALTSPAILLAAELWADTRREGAPTTGPDRLDIDVILAAQVQLYATALDTAVILATTKVRHLVRFVDARTWQDIAAS